MKRIDILFGIKLLLSPNPSVGALVAKVLGKSYYMFSFLQKRYEICVVIRVHTVAS